MSSAPVVDTTARLDWDGGSLRWHAPGAGDTELHLDGVLFARWPVARSEPELHFDFAPGGQPRLQLQLKRGGRPLYALLEARWRQPGLVPATSEPLPLAPLVDVDAAWRLDADAMARMPTNPVMVIVPVYNAAAAFARCLAALRRYTLAPARLLLVDDASDAPAIAPLLAQAAQWPGVEVLRNERNLGFTVTVNRALRRCGDGDVVLLNADTEVGPGWLGALRAAAWARPDIASATAVSNNAGAFSVPEIECANRLPDGWDCADAARALRQSAGLIQPELPTGNGFCMLMRADALARVGGLDAAAFAQGYGEENDWCQRAAALGWRHVIAGNVFVGHARSQSFGDARRLELGECGMAILRQRYPRYEADVAASLWSFARLALDWRVRRLWRAAGAGRPRPRLLQVGADCAGDGWPGWSAWRVAEAGGEAHLLDQAGAVIARAPATELSVAFPAWLQRHGIEAVVCGDPTRARVTRTCAALGVPCLPRAAALPNTW